MIVEPHVVATIASMSLLYLTFSVVNVKTEQVKLNFSSDEGEIVKHFGKERSSKKLLSVLDSKSPNYNILDLLITDVVPAIFRQSPANINGTAANEFAGYELTETENDDAVWMTTEELIEHAKFKHEVYHVVARDGYITKLIRVVNPLVKRAHLKWPPVVLMHGGTIDSTCFVMSSNIQHHPEKYPRLSEDGPISSWNRSLAFVLANNGFDVWLPQTRGSSQTEADHIKLHKSRKDLAEDMKHQDIERRKDPAAYEIKLAPKLNKINYWDFNQDDIIDYEMMPQIDSILSIAAHDWTHKHPQQVSLLGFSLSVPLTLSFFSRYPDYTKNRIHNYIALGPVVTKNALAPIPRLILSVLCPLTPVALGNSFVKFFTSHSNHALTNTLAKSKNFRYTVAKALAIIMFGPSSKYRSLVERTVVGHLLRTFGFKEAKQMCQQLKANRLQKYDYGLFKNRKLYGTNKPPVDSLSDLQLRDWAIIGSYDDTIAGPEAFKYLKKHTNPKPSYVSIAPKLDHFDIVSGIENGKYINLPILDYLNSQSKENIKYSN